MKKIGGPFDYSTAYNLLGVRKKINVNYNTYLKCGDDESIHLVFHWTSIIIYYPDGSIELNNGEFWKPTTRDRLNEYAYNINIRVHNGNWLVSRPSDINYFFFENHMVIHPDKPITTLPYGANYIEEKTGKNINSLDDIADVIHNCDYTILRKMWRKHLVRYFIAYYAPFDFLPLIASSATGEVSNAIKERFEKGK